MRIYIVFLLFLFLSQTSPWSQQRLFRCCFCCDWILPRPAKKWWTLCRLWFLDCYFLSFSWRRRRRRRSGSRSRWKSKLSSFSIKEHHPYWSFLSDEENIIFWWVSNLLGPGGGGGAPPTFFFPTLGFGKGRGEMRKTFYRGKLLLLLLLLLILLLLLSLRRNSTQPLQLFFFFFLLLSARALSLLYVNQSPHERVKLLLTLLCLLLWMLSWVVSDYWERWKLELLLIFRGWK